MLLSTPGVFAYVLRATKEGMNSVRGEKIVWKNAESSTKQLQQENTKKCDTTTNNKKQQQKLVDWIFSHDVVRWAADCLRVKLFFSVKNKWRQFDPPQMGTLKYYSTWSHWRLAVKAGTQASEEMGESAGGWEQHQHQKSQKLQKSLSIQNQTVQPQQALQLNHWLNLGTDSTVSRDRWMPTATTTREWYFEFRLTIKCLCELYQGLFFRSRLP